MRRGRRRRVQRGLHHSLDHLRRTAFFRPGRRASFISPGTPDRWKRPRQSSTVGRLTPTRAAIA